MQSILLVNLMRMGDILQTTPLIQSLRESFPGVRISMILNQSFEEVARRIDLDQRFPFPLGSLREMLCRKESLLDAHGFLQDFVQEVNGRETYDMVFNLTPSRSGAALSSMVSRRGHRGMWLERDGSFQAADPWAAYLVAMMANRRSNPFHLVDIWLRGMEQKGPRSLRMALTSEDVTQAESLLRDSGVRLDQDLLIGFQVSASQKEKCWSEKEYVRLGRALTENLRARVLLFGLAHEHGLCQGVSDRIPGSINLAGKTGLGVLGGVLKKCRVLITNDTGTQHVAAAVGTPVIVVSVGPVFFRETGPYGEGHRVFQARVPCAPCSFQVSCLNPVCKEKIRAEQIYAAVVQMLRGESAVDPTLPPDVVRYRSGFDDQGWLEFVSDSSNADDGRIQACKAFWCDLLEGRPGSRPEPVSGWLDSESEARRGRLEAFLKRSSKLMAQIGREGEARRTDPGRLRILSQNLRAAEQDLRRLALEAEGLGPLVNFLFIRREALSFREPFRFLEQASALYATAAEKISRGHADPRERKEAICHGM